MKFVLELGSNRDLTGTSWSRLRAIVKKRDRAICQYCGVKAEDGQVDHIIPLSRGGTDKLDNLAWSCSECNQRKNARLPLVPPRPRPIFRLLFAGFAELILEKLVGRYPDPDGVMYEWDDAYETTVKKMKSQKVRDWIRKTVWPDDFCLGDYVDFDEGIFDDLEMGQ